MKCPSCGTENKPDAKFCTFCSSPLATHSRTPFGETRVNAPDRLEAIPDGELIANRYQIVRELGRGGMGVVYLVKDQMLQGQEVALKMISSSLVKDPAAHNRFVQEVLAVQSLSHVNIVNVFHLDRYEGQDFFIMEYLPGTSLREIMVKRQQQDQVFTLKEAVSIISPILTALAHAHDKNIIHRDLKPENIIVSGQLPNIEIKVVDFGLARIMSPSRLTSNAMSMGTAYYMSPEQLAGKGEVDERSDLFAVGVILYELITDEIPSGLFEMPTEIIHNLPGAIDQVIKKSLSKKPEGRYSNVCELRTALSDLSDKKLRPPKKAKQNQKADAENKPPVSRKVKTFSMIGVAIVLIFVSMALILTDQKSEKPIQSTTSYDEPSRTSPDKPESRSPSVHQATPHSSSPQRRPEAEPSKPAPPVIKKYALTVRPNPSDATVEIVNNNTRYYPGISLEPDDYHVRVSKSGFMDYDKWVSIKNDDVSISADLEQMTYAFTVKPDPADTTVRILNIDSLYYDGIKLEPGRYHVEVSKSGYETNDTWVELKEMDFYYPVELKKIVATTQSSITNTLGMEFVYIKPGTFMMGSPSSESGRKDDETQHRVTLTRGYYLQTTEVTQGQWRIVMGSNPSKFSSCGEDCPVEFVSWEDVQDFIRKLNDKEGIKKYRLPTEAEWEYACRAGSETPFSTGKCLSTSQANYKGNYSDFGCSKGQYRNKTIPVGSFLANAWGLYDMHGNVLEWCSDWNENYPSGSVIDPEGPSSGSILVGRGGGYGDSARSCRSAYRFSFSPDIRYTPLGFRLVRNL